MVQTAHQTGGQTGRPMGRRRTFPTGRTGADRESHDVPSFWDVQSFWPASRRAHSIPDRSGQRNEPMEHPSRRHRSCRSPASVTFPIDTSTIYRDRSANNKQPVLTSRTSTIPPEVVVPCQVWCRRHDKDAPLSRLFTAQAPGEQVTSTHAIAVERTYQPRFHHSSRCGRSVPSVVSSP
jgi:hypothetical protein